MVRSNGHGGPPAAAAAQAVAGFEDGQHQLFEQLKHRNAGLRAAPVGGLGHAAQPKRWMKAAGQIKPPQRVEMP